MFITWEQSCPMWTSTARGDGYSVASMEEIWSSLGRGTFKTPKAKIRFKNMFWEGYLWKNPSTKSVHWDIDNWDQKDLALKTDSSNEHFGQDFHSEFSCARSLPAEPKNSAVFKASTTRQVWTVSVSISNRSHHKKKVRLLPNADDKILDGED